MAQIVVGVVALLLTAGASAQGVTYAVRIDAPRQLDDLLEDNLDLMRFRGNARMDLDQLQRLVRDARVLALSLGVFFPVAGREQPVQPGDRELDLVLAWFVKQFRQKA